MNSIHKICLAVVAYVLFVPSVMLAPVGAGQPTSDGILTGEAIVRVRPEATIEQFLAAFNQTWPGTTVLDSIPAQKIYRLQLPPEAVGGEIDVVEPQLAQFINEGKRPVAGKPLAWAELNWTGEAPEGRTGSVVVTAIDGGQSYDAQYPINVLGLSSAHGSSTGLGTVVAVLDTGVDASHPMLAGRVLTQQGYNFVTKSAVTNDAGDSIDNDGDGLTDEMAGHGTFVAGLVLLVAPDAKILPVAVLDTDGVGDSFEIAEGIYFAVERGVEVINLSLGSTYKSAAIEDAVEYAKSFGIPVVSAGGNQNSGQEFEEFPASASNGFGIAAVDQNDIRAPFSNYNDNFLLSAPGTSALTGSNPGDYVPGESIVSTLPNGNFGAWEGTSFAVPLVSGTVALIRAQHPEWMIAGGGPITLEGIYDSIELRLINSSVNIDSLNPQYAEELGAGRLATDAAVALGPVAPVLGDLNANGVVDQLDLDIFNTQWGLVHSAADFDGSGHVDVPDLRILLSNWDGVAPVPGDIVDSSTFEPPGDGVVDGADLAVLLAEWGLNPGSPADMVGSATFTPPSDGDVDGADLAWLLMHWTR